MGGGVARVATGGGGLSGARRVENHKAPNATAMTPAAIQPSRWLVRRASITVGSAAADGFESASDEA